MQRRKQVLLGALLGCVAFGLQAQQLPAGTHSADQAGPDEAVNQQIRDAESDLEKQDYKGAEAKLIAIVATHPHDSRVLYDLGFAQESNGEEADAAKSYAASIVADGGFAEPRVALGLLDARAGRVQVAHDELLAVAKMTAAPLELRGRALRALARLDERTAPADAQQELLAAVKLTGETPEDVAMGADLASKAGDSTDAEAAYRRALQLNPEDVDATAGLAQALRREGKIADAETLLVGAIKTHPDDPRLVSQLATVYVGEDKAAQAVPLLEQVRASSPRLAADPAVTRLLAQVYAMSGDNANAERLYAQLSAADPKDPALLDALGGVEVKDAHYAEAQATLAQAVAMRDAFHDDAAWGEAAGHLAFAASKNAQPQITLQALAARATVLPNSPASLFLEATAHDTLHQYREAARAYRAFLALADGKYPDEEFEARHRLIAVDRMK